MPKTIKSQVYQIHQKLPKPKKYWNLSRNDLWKTNRSVSHSFSVFPWKLKPRADCYRQVRNPLWKRVTNENHTRFWFQVSSILFPRINKRTKTRKTCVSYSTSLVFCAFPKALMLCRKMWSLQGRSGEAIRQRRGSKTEMGTKWKQKHPLSLAS